MIGAITTTKLRIVGMQGHSNCNSLAGSDQMLLAHPDLIPAHDELLDPTRQFWDNIFVFTSAHGWPGTGGTPPDYAVDDGEWLEMTAVCPTSPSGAHPHPSPYAYPNTSGAPYPNYVQRADNFNRGTGGFSGIELPLMCRLSNYWTDQVGLVKLSIPGTRFLRYDLGENANNPFATPSSAGGADLHIDYVNFPYFNWWTPADQFDWAPGTGRLYDRWLEKAQAAIAALPDGTTGSIDVVLCWFGDNDCVLDSPRVEFWEDDVRKYVKRLRADMVRLGLTTLPAEEIRILWFGVHRAYNLMIEGQNETMNAAVQRAVADDPFMRFIPVDDLQVFTGIDEAHYNQDGYFLAHRLAFEAIKEMDVDPFAALDQDDLLTVNEMRNRIRLHYSRGNSETDLDDNVLLVHLNGAMHHVFNLCGDYAYWRENRQDFELAGSSTGEPITLPKYVKRLLEIEDPGDATYPLQFEQVGHAQGGKVQVVLKEAVNGTYTCRYIAKLYDLTVASQNVPIPPELTEWLVTECCLRLARASSNQAHLATWMAEVQRLQVDALKNMSQQRRARKERLSPIRRLPTAFRRRRW